MTQNWLQDGTVMAAKILTNATRNGKRVTAGNIAFAPCNTSNPAAEPWAAASPMTGARRGREPKAGGKLPGPAGVPGHRTRAHERSGPTMTERTGRMVSELIGRKVY
jgi:hypothetical protein